MNIPNSNAIQPFAGLPQHFELMIQELLSAYGQAFRVVERGKSNNLSSVIRKIEFAIQIESIEKNPLSWSLLPTALPCSIFHQSLFWDAAKPETPGRLYVIIRLNDMRLQQIVGEALFLPQLIDQEEKLDPNELFFRICQPSAPGFSYTLLDGLFVVLKEYRSIVSRIAVFLCNFKSSYPFLKSILKEKITNIILLSENILGGELPICILQEWLAVATPQSLKKRWINWIHSDTSVGLGDFIDNYFCLFNVCPDNNTVPLALSHLPPQNITLVEHLKTFETMLKPDLKSAAGLEPLLKELIELREALQGYHKQAELLWYYAIHDPTESGSYQAILRQKSPSLPGLQRDCGPDRIIDSQLATINTSHTSLQSLITLTEQVSAWLIEQLRPLPYQSIERLQQALQQNPQQEMLESRLDGIEEELPQTIPKNAIDRETTREKQLELTDASILRDCLNIRLKNGPPSENDRSINQLIVDILRNQQQQRIPRIRDIWDFLYRFYVNPIHKYEIEGVCEHAFYPQTSLYISTSRLSLCKRACPNEIYVEASSYRKLCADLLKTLETGRVLLGRYEAIKQEGTQLLSLLERDSRSNSLSIWKILFELSHLDKKYEKAKITQEEAYLNRPKTGFTPSMEPPGIEMYHMRIWMHSLWQELRSLLGRQQCPIFRSRLPLHSLREALNELLEKLPCSVPAPSCYAAELHYTDGSSEPVETWIQQVCGNNLLKEAHAHVDQWIKKWEEQGILPQAELLQSIFNLRDVSVLALMPISYPSIDDANQAQSLLEDIEGGKWGILDSLCNLQHSLRICFHNVVSDSYLLPSIEMTNKIFQQYPYLQPAEESLFSATDDVCPDMENLEDLITRAPQEMKEPPPLAEPIPAAPEPNFQVDWNEDIIPLPPQIKLPIKDIQLIDALRSFKGTSKQLAQLLNKMGYKPKLSNENHLVFQFYNTTISIGCGHGRQKGNKISGKTDMMSRVRREIERVAEQNQSQDASNHL